MSNLAKSMSQVCNLKFVVSLTIVFLNNTVMLFIIFSGIKRNCQLFKKVCVRHELYYLVDFEWRLKIVDGIQS